MNGMPTVLKNSRDTNVTSAEIGPAPLLVLAVALASFATFRFQPVLMWNGISLPNATLITPGMARTFSCSCW